MAPEQAVKRRSPCGSNACLRRATQAATCSGNNTVDRASCSPIGISWTEVRLRHFRTVFGFRWYCAASSATEAFDRCIAALTACRRQRARTNGTYDGSIAALPCNFCRIVHPSQIETVTCHLSPGLNIVVEGPYSFRQSHHRHPLFSTWMMPDRTRQSPTRRAPGWFFGRCGSITAHGSSVSQNRCDMQACNSLT